MTKKTGSQSADYTVGYGRPPLARRFVKGKSGNAKGRPRGRVGFMARIAKLLDKRVTVREGDRVHKMTWLEALVSTTMQRALKGDVAAARVLLAIVRTLDSQVPNPAADAVDRDLSADDLSIIEKFLARNSGRPSDQGE